MAKIQYTDCEAELLPIQDALEVIHGKWKLLIILSVEKGNHRFSEIERSIPKLNAKVLAKELKDLEQHDLLKRTVYDKTPVIIEYTTTSYAKTLVPIFKALSDWGRNHRKRVIASYRKKEK